MCNIELLKFAMFGAGIACAGSLMAEELMPISVQDQLQWMQQTRIVGDQEQGAFREEVQNRIRSLNREEQMLMRNTRFNGRAHISDENTDADSNREQVRSTFDERHAYGRGFESRQMQQGAFAVGGNPAGSGSRAGQNSSGMSGGHSRGR
jgi:hypothetical protein